VEENKGGNAADEYKEEEKKVKRLIRNAKRRFEKNLADSDSSREFFAYIRKKTKSRPTIGPLKTRDKKVVSDDEEMATMLNEFFSSVFTREDESQTPTAEEMETTSRLDDIVITEWMVRKKIRKLRRAAAPGPDGIGPRLLQELEDEIVGCITLIFRK